MKKDFKEMSFMEVIDFMGKTINKDLNKDELNDREITILIGMIDVLRYITSDETSSKLMLLGIFLMTLSK